MRAYLGVIEETGRPALHMHLVVHTDGLTPEVVTQCVYDPVCYAKMAALANSQLQAWMPRTGGCNSDRWHAVPCSDTPPDNGAVESREMHFRVAP